MKKQLRYFFSLIFFLTASTPLMAQHVVISEYWANLTGTGAPFNAPFVELYNPTSSDVNMSTWSIQYKSGTSAGTFNVTAFPANSIIKAHGYFLVQLASSSTPISTNPLPTPDAVSTIQVAASAGKIALVASTTAINIPAPPTNNPDTYPNVVDFLGFGTGVDVVYEGTGSGPATTGAKSIERKANAGSTATSMISTGADYQSGNGYDTDDNANDFLQVSNINPQNSSSAIEAAFVTPSVTSLDFGTNQTTGTISTAQNFSLTGILSANAAVSTSAPYAVSKDGTNFSTSISFTPAEIKATPNPLVYVNFAPTVTTASPGSVSITSTNATTQTVNLTGTGSAAADVTPPVNATNYPKTNNITTTSIDVVSNLNETGTTYYVLIPATGTAPTTVAQIVAGKDGNNNTVATSGSFAVTAANTDATKTISGLSPATAYNIYVVSQDAAGTPNVQTAFATLNVTTLKLNQTITFAATAAKTYGAADFDPGATSDNTTIGITYTSSDPTVATIIANKVHIVKAGPVTITANQAGSTLYNAATAQQQALTVNKASLTITANNVTKSYGSALTGGTGSGAFTSTALQNGESVGSVTITYGTGAAAADAAGTYNGSVVPSAATGGTFTAGNYNITYTAGNITVTATPIPTIGTTGALSALSTTYGTASTTGTFNVSGADMTAGILVTPPAGFEVSANATTGFGASVTVGAAGTIAATPVYIRLAATDVVNNYSGNVVLSSTGANNVTVAIPVSAVGKKTLTVTAANATKVYGAANPAFTVNYSGFVGADNATSLTTQPTGTTTATAASPVNTYAITPAGGVAANYTFSYAAGTLTVTPAALTITASNASKAYGAALPSLTPTYSGFVGADNAASLTTQPTVTTTATATSAIGTYPTTASGAVSANYTFTYVAGTLTVTTATLTVTANSPAKVYGAANPALLVSYSGFVGTDNAASLTTQPTVGTTATTSSPVGTYPVTASGGTSTNYTFAYVAGTLTVSKAALTITADNKSVAYGAAIPALTATYTGFVGTDNAASLTTAPVLSATANASSAPGSYPISVSGAASNNYNITYTAGTLTVVPSSDATLSNIKLNAGDISPKFSSAITSYIDSVDNAIYYLNLTPTAHDNNATITVNGVGVTSGKASATMPVNTGNTPITIVVTAQDGVTQNTYTVTVYKGLPSSAVTATNILTPNGDGKNDTWVIKDIQLFPNNFVNVYDRGGRVVYSKHGYANEWNATLNGAPLNEGTYYYTVDLGTSAPVIKGYITILRNR
ncbi:MBG domain-containing protein [Mucilaginibacter sp. AW1-3]